MQLQAEGGVGREHGLGLLAEHAAEHDQAGGREVMRDVYRDQGVHAIPANNTGAQMGGWFRREVRTVDEMKGLKMRIAGLAGLVMGKLGVVAQQLAPGDIYPATSTRRWSGA